MREILFKAKRKDNGEWIEGYLYINGRNGKREILCYEKDVNIEKVTYEVQAETVCQYTGLKDKNGKEMYEGDIVEVTDEDEYLHLEWEEDTASFVMSGRHFVLDFDTYWSYEIEVVGNIFDNPELLNDVDKQAGEYADNEVLKLAT